MADKGEVSEKPKRSRRGGRGGRGGKARAETSADDGAVATESEVEAEAEAVQVEALAEIDDDAPVGRILSRREVLALFGFAGASLIAACTPQR